MRHQDIILFGGMFVSWQLHLIMLMSPPPQASTSDSRIFDLLFVESAEETRRKKRKMEREALPHMRNICGHESPLLPLGPPKDRFGNLCADPNREYVKKLTHMYSWEVIALAELVQKYLEAPRETSWRPTPTLPPGKKRGRPPKYDYINRLQFVLEWLSSGDDVHRRELEYSYSKTAGHEDIKHVLRAINKALEGEIEWPDAAARVSMRATYTGIFFGRGGGAHAARRRRSLSKRLLDITQLRLDTKDSSSGGVSVAGRLDPTQHLAELRVQTLLRAISE